MKNLYVALMVLLCVGVNVFGMEQKNTSWIFDSLTLEQLHEFQNQMESGVIASDLIVKYNALEEKRQANPGQFSNEDCRELTETKDFLDDMGLGYFVLVQQMKWSSQKPLESTWLRNGSDKAKRNLSSRYSSSSSDDGERPWIFHNYTATDIALMSISSESSSSNSSE